MKNIEIPDNKLIFQRKLIKIEGITPLCNLIGVWKDNVLVQSNLSGSVFWTKTSKISIINQ